jgi:secreted trypsin-like serine protease
LCNRRIDASHERKRSGYKWLMSSSFRFCLVLLALSATAEAHAQRPNCAGWRDPASRKVVGGADAPSALWPSQAVFRLTASDGQQQFICGGTAVSSHHVVTAAHCFDYIEKRGNSFASTFAGTRSWLLDVVIGTHDLDDVTTATSFPIGDVLVHEGYAKHRATTQGNDLALVRLGRDWTGPVPRLSLDDATDPTSPPGASLSVAGFGLLEGAPRGGTLRQFRRNDGTVYSAGSRFLQYVSLPLISNDECVRRWSSVGPGQLCAGYSAPQALKDSCGGDSGGPLVWYDRQGCPTHVGLVSWGPNDCGRPRAYGVYTRFSRYATWLRERADVTDAPRPNRQAPDLTGAEFIAQASSVVAARRGVANIVLREGSTFRIGAYATIEVHSSVQGRLIVVVIDPARKAKVLSTDQALVMRAGHPITTSFQSVGPAGQGELIALVVPSDFDVRPTQTANGTNDLAPGSSSVGYLMNLLLQIEHHIATKGDSAQPSWAFATFDYEFTK